MLEVNIHGGVLPPGGGRPQVEGAARGDPAIPAAGVRRPASSVSPSGGGESSEEGWSGWDRAHAGRDEGGPQLPWE
jgi:hypothetical protein